MRADARAERFVQRARGDIDVLLIRLGGKRRAAGFAAGDRVRRAQRERRAVVFAVQPAEAILRHDQDGVPGRARRLAAQRAMAHPHAIEIALDRIPPCPAKTASRANAHVPPFVPTIATYPECAISWETIEGVKR